MRSSVVKRTRRLRPVRSVRTAPTVKINGTNLGPAPVVGWVRQGQGGAFGLASYASPSSVITGDNTLTVALPVFAQGTVDRAMLNGLIVEWPVA
jgi:hypothetical protein